jgi:hypothetical protein
VSLSFELTGHIERKAQNSAHEKICGSVGTFWGNGRELGYDAKTSAKKNRRGRLRRCAIDMETTHSQGSTGRRAGGRNSKASRHLCPAENVQSESAMTLAAIQEKNATRT